MIPYGTETVLTAPEHMAVMDKAQNELGRFVCPECELRFWTVGDKKRHMRTEHPS